MTYGQPPVCRRGGCGNDALEDQRGLEVGDQNWCQRHLDEVRAARLPYVVGRIGARGGSHRSEPRPGRAAIRDAEGDDFRSFGPRPSRKRGRPRGSKSWRVA